MTLYYYKCVYYLKMNSNKGLFDFEKDKYQDLCLLHFNYMKV